MVRLLGTMLCLIAAVGFVAAPASAAVQNVKVSGDITAVGAMRELGVNNNNQVGSESNDKRQFMAGIVRLRVDADLSDNVSTTIRLLNERVWGSNDEGTANSDMDLDLASVTLREFLYSPATLTIGKQELHFGNDMIVGDTDTNNMVTAGSAFDTAEEDLSARKAFDAIRLTLDYNPLVLDVVAAKIQEDALATDNDEDLYGINANYALSDNTVLEGYWWERHLQNKANAQNKTDRTDVLGGRIVNKSIKDLTLQLEAAAQLGTSVLSASNTAKRKAWAIETAATYNMPNVKYTPTLTGIYAYLTGRKGDDSKRDTAWSPMYENQTWGHIANAQFNQANVHIAGAVATMKPAEDLLLKGEYFAYWWDKKYGDGQSISTVRGDSAIMKNEKFAGQEIDITGVYDYTEDVQFSLLSGIFIPGSAFDKRTDNIATEVIGAMKVTF